MADLLPRALLGSVAGASAITALGCCLSSFFPVVNGSTIWHAELMACVAGLLWSIRP